MSARRLLFLLVAALLLPTNMAVGQKRDDADMPDSPAAAGANTERDIREGRVVVRAHCSVCHGPDGKGGRGPNLTARIFRHGTSDQAIFDNIKEGIPGTDMPAFSFSDHTLWQIVSYIRSERQAPQPELPGDKVRGGELFTKHQCAACHWTGTEGGRRAPDLSASAAAVDYVRTSIMTPDANFLENPAYQHNPYQRVAIITMRGKILEGRWLNENAYFVQLMDEQEQLHTLARDDIDEMHKPMKSLMPTLKLSEEDLTDLVKYVFSLRPPLPTEGESE